LLEQLSAKELNKKCQQYIHIKVDNPNKAVVILETQLKTTQYEVLPDETIKLFSYLDFPGGVSEMLAHEGLSIEEFMPMKEDLESYFTKRIGGVEL
jgi:ABC-2 type transport system ATP-binding protein